MNFQDLIYEWGPSYFTTIFSLLCAIIGFVLIRKKHASQSIFLYYFGAYIALIVVYSLSSLFLADRITSRSIHYLELYADYLFTIFEFCVFAYFFQQKLLYQFHRRILSFLSFVYLGSSVLVLIKDLVSHHNLQMGTEYLLWALQAICLIIPCVLYFIEIFRKPEIYLSRTPGFWIVSGLSFFMISSLPFSLFSNYIEAQSPDLAANFTAIFNIFYCLLFMMITKAHFCKMENSTKKLERISRMY
jgi:hypothetical protein